MMKNAMDVLSEPAAPNDDFPAAVTFLPMVQMELAHAESLKRVAIRN